MSQVRVYADPEVAARSWVLTNERLRDMVTGVDFSLDHTQGFPRIAITLIEGGPDDDQAPTYGATVQFDVWGDGQKKADCARIALALQAEIESIESGDPMGEDARARWAFVQSNLFVPNPETNQVRYAVTADFVISAEGNQENNR